MRQVQVTVPADRSDDIVSVLQDNCKVSSLFRHTEDNISCIQFYARPNVTSHILYELDKVGCGVAYGKIALLPVEMVKPLPRVRGPLVVQGVEETKKKQSKEARLAIEEMFWEISDACGLSFDFVAFIVVASLVAGLGLATNNTVMIVASMLVSPLMSPILAFTFGTAVRDLALIKRGVYVEIVGVIVTFMVGMFVGVIFCPFADEFEWPTNEMSSRGDKTGLLVGLAFAIPSGAGVALSVTGGGGNALVGVAIAASLLPPVVNSGMCLTFGLLGRQWVDGDFPSSQYFYEVGGLSFCLFLLNVGVIYVVALLFFMGKNIKPVRRQLADWKELPKIPTKMRKIQKEAEKDSGASGNLNINASSGGAASVVGGPVTPRAPPQGSENLESHDSVAAAILAKNTWAEQKGKHAEGKERQEEKDGKGKKAEKEGEKKESAGTGAPEGASGRAAPPAPSAPSLRGVAATAPVPAAAAAAAAAAAKTVLEAEAAAGPGEGSGGGLDAIASFSPHDSDRELAASRWKILRQVVLELHAEGALEGLGAGRPEAEAAPARGGVVGLGSWVLGGASHLLGGGKKKAQF